MARPIAAWMSLWSGLTTGGDLDAGMARPPKAKPTTTDDERSPQETERIREATLKRILSTPPKSHKDMVAERKSKGSKKK